MRYKLKAIWGASAPAGALFWIGLFFLSLYGIFHLAGFASHSAVFLTETGKDYRTLTGGLYILAYSSAMILTPWLWLAAAIRILSVFIPFPPGQD